jgi:hypothetical protein
VKAYGMALCFPKNFFFYGQWQATEKNSKTPIQHFMVKMFSLLFSFRVCPSRSFDITMEYNKFLSKRKNCLNKHFHSGNDQPCRASMSKKIPLLCRIYCQADFLYVSFSAVFVFGKTRATFFCGIYIFNSVFVLKFYENEKS